MTLHADEFEIALPLVRRLVDSTFPDLAALPIRPLDVSGSSNALFRLGTELLVRLPRQPGGSEAITREARWLPYLAAALPVTLPQIVRIGEPAVGFPEYWSIVRWIAGQPPDVPPPPDSTTRLARDLAAVVAALRQTPVPPPARTDPALRLYRAEPVSTMDATARRDIAACHSVPGLDLDLDACLRVWDAAMALPEADEGSAPSWLHGDLLAENLLVRDGRLAAVLDFGGLAVGDPTVDLIVAWEVLDAHGRDVFCSALEVDDVSWLRGRAWALAIAVMTFPYYWRTMPARCTARLAMARAVLADAASAG